MKRFDEQRRRFLTVSAVGLGALILSGCASKMQMENLKGDSEKYTDKKTVGSDSMLIRPDRSLGLEPTPAICDGKISTFLVAFPLELFAEWFPGRLRWDTWTISDKNSSEHRGQVLFSGMNNSGFYSGINVIDGTGVVSGYTAILSSAVDVIYSPVPFKHKSNGQEAVGCKKLAVEREKFLKDPDYRRKMIVKVNANDEGKIFNISEFSEFPGFKWYVRKQMNQLHTPDGYLLTPYGRKEVALIRGINPQYTYFEKLIGTGTFSITPSFDLTTLAFVNSIGLLMDMLRAAGADTRGWDFGSVVSIKQEAFKVKYLLSLAQNEVIARNVYAADLEDKNSKLTAENKKLKKELEALRAGGRT